MANTPPPQHGEDLPPIATVAPDAGALADAPVPRAQPACGTQPLGPIRPPLPTLQHGTVTQALGVVLNGGISTASRQRLNRDSPMQPAIGQPQPTPSQARESRTLLVVLGSVAALVLGIGATVVYLLTGSSKHSPAAVTDGSSAPGTAVGANHSELASTGADQRPTEAATAAASTSARASAGRRAAPAAAPAAKTSAAATNSAAPPKSVAATFASATPRGPKKGKGKAKPPKVGKVAF